MFASVSVQQRLTAIVVIQAVSAALLLAIAFSAMGRLVSHTRYTSRFILEPLAEIGATLEANAHVRAKSMPLEDAKAVVEKTQRFAARYRTSWQLAGSNNPDALRQLEELRVAGATNLVDRERLAVDALVAATEHLDASVRAQAPPSVLEENAIDQRAALYRLLDVNLEFAAVARNRSEAITSESYRLMGIVGGLAIVASMLCGVRVRNAIVPRIRQLVVKVRRFQELGINEPVPEIGKDELSILSHALDVGFAAIVARELERDRFLAIIAHELKTPLSNIRGFAQVALAHPQREEVRARAIAIISRQANRVVRIVEDLFLVSRAHAHELPFAPAPMMLSPLVERIAAEVRHEGSANLHVDSKVAAPVLADETLLAHALWTMLAYAASRAGSHGVNVNVSLSAVEVTTLIDGFGPRFSEKELAKLFEPFTAVTYEKENAGDRRNILGLYLCQEIAKVHGGFVRAFNEPNGSPALALSLPI